jgi:hypothetical protein
MYIGQGFNLEYLGYIGEIYNTAIYALDAINYPTDHVNRAFLVEDYSIMVLLQK